MSHTQPDFSPVRESIMMVEDVLGSRPPRGTLYIGMARVM